MNSFLGNICKLKPRFIDRLRTQGPLTRTDKNNLDKLRCTSSSTKINYKEGYFYPAFMNKTNKISAIFENFGCKNMKGIIPWAIWRRHNVGLLPCPDADFGIKAPFIPARSKIDPALCHLRTPPISGKKTTHYPHIKPHIPDYFICWQFLNYLKSVHKWVKKILYSKFSHICLDSLMVSNEKNCRNFRGSHNRVVQRSTHHIAYTRMYTSLIPTHNNSGPQHRTPNFFN